MTEGLRTEQRVGLHKVEHSVYTGNITDVTADAIVRPASWLGTSGMAGGVEQAIHRAGGDDIFAAAIAENRREHAADSDFGARLGDIVVTGSGNMFPRIKKVIHVACHRSNGDIDKYAIKTSVKKVLKEADKRHLSSIAFPTMGAGVSREMGVSAISSLRYTMEGMQEYFSRHPMSSIRKTQVVMYSGDYQQPEQVQRALEHTYTKRELGRRFFRPLPLRLRRG